MIDLSPELVAVIMLGGIAVGALTGFPIAFVIGALGLVVGFTLWGSGVGDLLYSRSFGIVYNYVLLAAPLFIFMGLMLERSGITDKLYESLYMWLGGLRGSLSLVTILIGTILAACVGVASASIVMLCLVALPPMMKRGYDKGLAMGTICAGGCLGILIPPSVMLVVYGPMAGVSVGKLFMGAFIPGFVLSALYCIYIVARCYLEPQIAPSVPQELRQSPLSKKFSMLASSLLPPAILVLAVLGVIFFGVAPPTEAAAIGAFVATLLVIIYGRFSWKVLKEVTLDTVKTCGFIFLIATMSFAFVGVFLGSGADKVVTQSIMSMPGGKWGVFTLIMFICFILGFFLDWLGIVFILVPIISPIGTAMGFDSVWFSIMICVNLQTSFLTPPFAMAIFIAKGAAESSGYSITTAEIIRGVIPFVALILIGTMLCVAFPQLILWLPSQMIK